MANHGRFVDVNRGREAAKRISKYLGVWQLPKSGLTPFFIQAAGLGCSTVLRLSHQGQDR